MKRYVPALYGALAIFWGAQAPAQDLHPGIIGEDDRVRVDARGPPWDAIGQVNVAGYRITTRCTGTLVASDIVLPAAHCVMNPWRKAPFPLHDIHFLAGVHGSENKGHATAKCLHFPKGYKFVAPEKILPTLPTQKAPLRAFATDVVAIVLNEKLAVDPVPLAETVMPNRGYWYTLPTPRIGGLRFRPTSIATFYDQTWRGHCGSTIAIPTRRVPVVRCSRRWTACSSWQPSCLGWGSAFPMWRYRYRNGRTWRGIPPAPDPAEAADTRRERGEEKG